MKMITKEKFLENTTDEEVFCLVGEFLERWKKMILEDHPVTKEGQLYNYLPIDEQRNAICQVMIRDCKNSEYIGRGE